jgi:hypothetical protein
MAFWPKFDDFSSQLSQNADEFVGRDHKFGACGLGLVA